MALQCMLPKLPMQRMSTRAHQRPAAASRLSNCLHLHSLRPAAQLRPTPCRQLSRSFLTSSRRLLAVASSLSLSSYADGKPAKLTTTAKRVTNFALKFAALTETYEVHTWHLVLGLLQVKEGIAADVLREKGISNFHEAFLEVLYCLKMADALETKGYRATVTFTNRGTHVLEHARHIARSLGHSQVDTEHLLAALAYYEVLEAVFPDLNLSEEEVWQAINRKWEAKQMKSDLQLLDKHTKSFEKVFYENPKRLAYFPDIKRLENFDPTAVV